MAKIYKFISSYVSRGQTHSGNDSNMASPTAQTWQRLWPRGFSSTPTPPPSKPYANLSPVSEAYGINQGHPVKGGELALAIPSNGNQSAQSWLGLKAKVTAIKRSCAEQNGRGPDNQFNFSGQPTQRPRLSQPIREGRPGTFNASPSQIRNRPRDEKGMTVSRGAGDEGLCFM